MPRAVAGAAVIPAAPLLLPRVSPAQPPGSRDQVARLRELVRDALASLPEVDVHVLLAPGKRGIYDHAEATIEPLGVHGTDVVLPVAEDVIEHLSRLTQYPMLLDDPLSLPHSVLVALLHDVRGVVPVLPVNVPPMTDSDVLVSVGASISESIADAGLTAAVIATGDLSASLHDASPRYAVEGAPDWDQQVVEAVRAGSLRPLRDLGPDEAARVHALGWAPLVALHGACAAARLAVQLLGYEAPCGVGQLVARCVVAGEDGPRARFEREVPRGEEQQGVLPRTGDPRG